MRREETSVASAFEDDEATAEGAVVPISNGVSPPGSLMERQLRRYARDLSRVLAQERRTTAELREA